jgi:large subunit ribosomal protein L25
MAQAMILAAEARTSNGTGHARATRRAGLVPCIIYGNNEEP